MNVFGRFASGLPGAAIVTTILFLILAAMISQRQDIELSEDRSVDINVTRQLQDTSVQAQQEFQRPVLDQPPPPPPSPPRASTGRPDACPPSSSPRGRARPTP